MGLGDEILAAGQVERLSKIGTGERVIWNPLYDYIDLISKEGEWFIDYPGHRGYIDHVEDERVYFNYDYRAKSPWIKLDPIVTDYVIIEPNIKHGAPPAKQWNHYDEIVGEPYEFLQFNSDSLGVQSLVTDAITAARYIAGCRAYIGTEGLLHHLAAAFNRPAVVIIGAFSPPEVIGYESHINLTVDDPDELGDRRKYGAMERIKPETVKEALYDITR